MSPGLVVAGLALKPELCSCKTSIPITVLASTYLVDFSTTAFMLSTYCVLETVSHRCFS